MTTPLIGSVSSAIRKWLLGLSMRYKKTLVAVIDLVLAEATLWFAFSLRYETFFIPFIPQHWWLFILCPLIVFPIFVRQGLYRAIFRYSGFGVTAAIARAVAIYTIVFAACTLLISYFLSGVPRTIAIIQPFLFSWAVLAVRALGASLLNQPSARHLISERETLLIFGAGVSGIQTASALQSTGKYIVAGFIDDSQTKLGRQVLGVTVYDRPAAERLIRDKIVDGVLLAMPTISRSDRNAIIQWLLPFGAHVRSIPSVLDLATGRVTLTDFRELDIDDLLGREPVKVDSSAFRADVADRVVLVTGAGGSIGSELCRQLLAGFPSQLVLVESSELALYNIHEELGAICERGGLSTKLVPLLCNVQSARRVDEIFDLWRPNVVYHAAAYKHVPLVEHNVVAGIANNTIGTTIVAQAAVRSGAHRFVLISTDKAVRPTNVMGASKRLAEIVIQAMAAEAELKISADATTCINRTIFTMVRFGNVLGSSGSVVPLFRNQLAAGGPLTVTHPDVTRYFMTIPEAAQLVLQAGAAAKGGEVFLLDMGQPVRIMDLARRMIELSGATVRDDANPEGDVEIEITGLRPGEKLYEELLIDDTAIPSEMRRIMVARERTFAWSEISVALQGLRAALDTNDVSLLREILAAYVDGFAPEGMMSDFTHSRRAEAARLVASAP